MATKREKPVVITLKNTTKKSKHIDKKNVKTQRQQDKKQGILDVQNSQKTINKMIIISPHLSIIIPNINGLNSPIKRYRMDGSMIKNKIQQYSEYQETHFSLKDTHRLRVKEWKKIFKARYRKKKHRQLSLQQTKQALN